MKRVNNSIATKRRVALVKNCTHIFEIFLVNNTIKWLNCIVHYLNVKINKLKKTQCTVLKCTQMRARVEKVDVLGWNKSDMLHNLAEMIKGKNYLECNYHHTSTLQAWWHDSTSTKDNYCPRIGHDHPQYHHMQLSKTPSHY